MIRVRASFEGESCRPYVAIDNSPMKKGVFVRIVMTDNQAVYTALDSFRILQSLNFAGDYRVDGYSGGLSIVRIVRKPQCELGHILP
jgi:hypothetical protein